MRSREASKTRDKYPPRGSRRGKGVNRFVVRIRSTLAEIDPTPQVKLGSLSEMRDRNAFLKEQKNLINEQLSQGYMKNRKA